MTGKVIIRPFYPGGDYEACEYPDNGVVIDNPPFSIQKKIVEYYRHRNIPFFIFCEKKSSISLYDAGLSLIYISHSVRYANGAEVTTAFISNILPPGVHCAASLNAAISAQNSQIKEKKLVKYIRPANIFNFSDFDKIAKGCENYYIRGDDIAVASGQYSTATASRCSYHQQQ